MEISWQRCDTYAEARNATGIIYLHEWDDKPFYWGKAHRSFFGGHRRRIGDLLASGRYNSGYRHWIEGCLQHGAKLFIGTPSPDALARIDEVENFLIHTYGHVMNTRVKEPPENLQIEHRGEAPACLSATSKSAGFVSSTQT